MISNMSYEAERFTFSNCSCRQCTEDRNVLIVDLFDINARLRKHLSNIQSRAQSDGSKNFDQCIRDLGWIDDETRLALSQPPAAERHPNERS